MMVFVILLHLKVRKVNFLSRYQILVLLLVNLPFQKIHFMQLQPYDKTHCVYLARIGCHSEKKPVET